MFKKLSPKSLIKYFSLDQFRFLIQCLKQGSYNLITYDEQNKPVIATNFYIDGDVLHKLFESEAGGLRADTNLEFLKNHMTTVENNLKAMDIFSTQIQAIVTFALGTFTFVRTYLSYGWEVATVSTMSVGTIIFFFKKSLARAVFWALKQILQYYLGRVKKEVLE